MNVNPLFLMTTQSSLGEEIRASLHLLRQRLAGGTPCLFNKEALNCIQSIGARAQSGAKSLFTINVWNYYHSLKLITQKDLKELENL